MRSCPAAWKQHTQAWVCFIKSPETELFTYYRPQGRRGTAWSYLATSGKWVGFQMESECVQKDVECAGRAGPPGPTCRICTQREPEIGLGSPEPGNAAALPKLSPGSSQRHWTTQGQTAGRTEATQMMPQWEHGRQCRLVRPGGLGAFRLACNV